jgi:hypothetical protein
MGFSFGKDTRSLRKGEEQVIINAIVRFAFLIGFLRFHQLENDLRNVKFSRI